MIEIKSNKIWFTNDVFKAAIKLRKLSSAILITPFSTYDEIINLNKSNPLFRDLLDLINEQLSEIINNDILGEITSKLRVHTGTSIVGVDYNPESLVKNLFELISTPINTYQDIEKLLNYISQRVSKMQNIIIIGKQFNGIANANYSMLNVIHITDDIQTMKINYNLLESIIADFNEEPFEIIEVEKFHNWLEFLTKTTLSRKDIENYLNNGQDFTSYTINQALKSLK